jgi:pimeloyl-ACP methyl ester carboxylesterase
MDRVSVGGVSLAYEVQGRGDAVLFVHGALIADAFRPLLARPELVEGFRCIAYHRRGYGESDHPPGELPLGRNAEDILHLLDQVDVEGAHVVGHSHGGCVAVQLALDAPDRVHTSPLRAVVGCLSMFADARSVGSYEPEPGIRP